MFVHPVHLILLLSGLLVGALLRSAYLSRRQRKAEAALASGGAAQFLDEVQRMKGRLAVLERIAVEKENSLEREIEQLRDRP